MNRQAEWRVKKSIRTAAAIVGRSHRPQLPAPIDYPVTITVIWEVTDNRVRDASATAPTGKAAIDGLVDAGLLLSDRHSIVVEERYRIEVGQSKGVRLEIRAVDA